MTGARMADPVLGSEESLAAFMEGFFNGTFPGKDWHHREHVIMAGWYLLRYSEAETIERASEAIKRYNISQGGQNTDSSGYHHTLTVLWVRIMGHALARQPAGLGECERLRLLADEYSTQTRLYQEYYSFDVVKSTAARLSWVEPDLRRLPEISGGPAQISENREASPPV